MTLVASRSGRRSASAVAAWAAATAAAAGVAWLGVDSVLIPAAETPPAVLAAGASPTRTAAPASSPAASPGTAPAAGAAPSRSATPRGSAAPTASPSVPATASPTDGGKLSRYQTGGGVVVLSIGAHMVTLVSATPAAGYSVQNWSAPGWLRVDFTEGSTVYSVYATWNGYSPQVQVVGPN